MNETRCYTMYQKYKKKKVEQEDILKMMESSKNLYNSVIYFERKWYELWQLMLRFYSYHVDKYLTSFSRKDIETLFKYELGKQNKVNLEKLYSKYGNPSLLELVSDDILKRQLQSLELNPSCEDGRTQGSEDILRSIERLEGSNVFADYIQSIKDSHREQVFGFIPNLKLVLVLSSENRYKTTENQIKKKEHLKQEDEEKQADKDYQEYMKAKKKHDTNINLIPPSYLYWGLSDLYLKKNIQSYYELNSQVSQQTIKKVDKAYASYFELKQRFKASPPKYNKIGKYNLIFQKDSFKVIDRKIRISLSKQLKTERLHNGGSGYIYFDLPRQLMNTNIKEIEVVPSAYLSSKSYKVIIKYEKLILEPQKDINNLRKAAIDFGMVNLVTMFSPCFANPVIFSGRSLLNLNKKYNNILDGIKSKIKADLDKNTDTKLQYTLVSRKHKIDDYFNKVSTKIIRMCQNVDIREVVIGYNCNWKKNVNMGHLNNRRFYEIPYRRFVDMLFHKGKDIGINVVENEEAYTSKCDALGIEDIKKHEQYMGKKVKRGLFQSSRNILLNADVNGAINILRKYIYKSYTNLCGELDLFLKNLQPCRVCNPKKFKFTADVRQAGYKGLDRTMYSLVSMEVIPSRINVTLP